MQAKNYGLLIMISLLWGSQFLFNDMALKSFGPIFIATSRAMIAAVTLMLLLLILPRRQVTSMAVTMGKWKYYRAIFFISLTEATLPFFLVVWGQQHINSSLTAIFIATIPIFTTLFVMIFAKDETVHRGTIISVLLGFIGIVILVFPGLDLHSPQGIINILGEAAVLVGAISFAVSLILVKKLKSTTPMRTARDIFVFASLQMIGLSLIIGVKMPQHMTVTSVLALLALGVFCAGIVYCLYVILIGLAGATFSSFSNYLVPLVGILLGVLILGEAVVLNQLIALFVIFLAMIANECYR